MADKDDQALDSWLALLQARELIAGQLSDTLERDAGQPLSYFEVLIHLAAAEGGSMRMVDLAETVLLSKSGVTRLVDRLEADGLVERQSCPGDRRAINATITPAGRAALKRALPVHTRALDEIFADHLTVAELKALQALLGKVLSANGKRLDTCSIVATPSEARARAG